MVNDDEPEGTERERQDSAMRAALDDQSSRVSRNVAAWVVFWLVVCAVVGMRGGC